MLEDIALSLFSVIGILFPSVGSFCSDVLSYAPVIKSLIVILFAGIPTSSLEVSVINAGCAGSARIMQINACVMNELHDLLNLEWIRVLLLFDVDEHRLFGNIQMEGLRTLLEVLAT